MADAAIDLIDSLFQNSRRVEGVEAQHGVLTATRLAGFRTLGESKALKPAVAGESVGELHVSELSASRRR